MLDKISEGMIEEDLEDIKDEEHNNTLLCIGEEREDNDDTEAKGFLGTGEEDGYGIGLRESEEFSEGEGSEEEDEMEEESDEQQFDKSKEGTELE